MDRQPKLELDPLPMVTISDSMTIQAMVAHLRVTNVWEDYDKLEEILLSREERANQEIGQLKERTEMERLAKVHALEEFKKREEMCEKGKKFKEAYETLLRNVKTTKFAERETIVKMSKKNGELESEVLGFRKLNGELEREVSELRKLKEKCVEVSDLNIELRKMNGELEREVCELRKLKGKLVDENTQLRSMICVLEGERNTLVALMSKDNELDDEKCKYEKMVESLNRKFEDDDTKRLMSVDVFGGGNNEEELFADNGVTFNEKDEGDVQDNELGNDKVRVSLQRNGDISYSPAAAAGTAQPLSKGNKDAKGSSFARGRMLSQKVIEIIDLDDDDDDEDECTSRVLHGKKAEFGITVKTEYPSSSVEIQQKNSFSKQSLEIKKRKISFSNSDTSTSFDTSVSSFDSAHNIDIKSQKGKPVIWSVYERRNKKNK